MTRNASTKAADESAVHLFDQDNCTGIAALDGRAIPHPVGSR